MSKTQTLLQRAATYIFLGLLAYMPLHIFLSTWLGTSFGVLEFAKIAKDIVLIIGFGITFYLSYNKPWFVAFLKNKLTLFIGVYVVFTVFLALVHPNQQDAELLGVVYNLRFLVFLVYGVLLSNVIDPTYIKKKALAVVLATGIIVCLFGVVQYTLLPDTALSHVGYSRQNGVLPAFFIDDKPDLERVMATLRDPNSLGSYLIIIVITALGLLIGTNKHKYKKIVVLSGIALSLLVLLVSFSRSGWLGMAVAIMVFSVLFVFRNSTMTQIYAKYKRLIIVGTATLVLLAGALFVAKDSYLVQNVILHADQSTTLEDPNELRLRFWSESIESTVDKPFGYGPGTAGLASIRNTEQGTVLNENYYLQLLHEVGVIGLLLFLSIIGFTARYLYKAFRSHNDLIALGLLAALAGLCVTNFLVHIWSNEAVTYTFWGLAGLWILPRFTAKKSTSKTS